MRLSILHRQRGKAYRNRVKQYRKNKQKAKLQSRRWRQRNRSKVKRYQKIRQRHPSQHRLVPSPRHASLEQLAGVPFWDLQNDLPGEIQKIDPSEGKVKTTLRDYDLMSFLDAIAIVTEEDEAELFEVLDTYLEVPEELDDYQAVYSYDRSRYSYDRR